MAKKKEAEPEMEAEAGAAKPEGEEGGEGEMAPKKGKRKLLMIVGAVVVLLLIGGGLFASGILGGGGKHEEKKSEEEVAAEAAAAVEASKPVYYELPQFLVNLNSPTGRVSFLKMSVTLQLKDQAAVAAMDANKPRVLDAFNTYLRELRPSDVQGSAGIYRLRDELMTRLNSTVEEGLVKDILFSEIIVQ
ncbi:MAG: flagellar basal body-associated FliL family protein [Rickettsiales bacterium]